MGVPSKGNKGVGKARVAGNTQGLWAEGNLGARGNTGKEGNARTGGKPEVMGNKGVRAGAKGACRCLTARGRWWWEGHRGCVG